MKKKLFSSIGYIKSKILEIFFFLKKQNKFQIWLGWTSRPGTTDGPSRSSSPSELCPRSRASTAASATNWRPRFLGPTLSTMCRSSNPNCWPFPSILSLISTTLLRSLVETFFFTSLKIQIHNFWLIVTILLENRLK